MTLCANAVTRRGREFRRIHHLRAFGDVVAARAVAPLARDAVFEKWRRCVTVQRSGIRLNAAGMAL